MFLSDYADSFRNAELFPHVIIDDYWDPDHLRDIVNEFPGIDDYRWVTYPDPKEWGKRCGGPEMFGPRTLQWFQKMFTDEAVIDIEGLTGIQPLVPDVVGGGMHMTSEGGRLESHVDFNIHPQEQWLERRINFLVFLNEGWKPEWGGNLLLGKEQQIQVIPEFNRTVIFETSDISWHGHPEPIVGDHHRKSLACYYYAPVRQETLEPHSTVWQEK